MEIPSPILVADRFPALLDRLVDLLSDLSAEEWARPTVATGWSVKDVALHLLGDDVGILSGKRDGFSEGRWKAETWEELVALINRSNDRWLQATRRISPRLLCELLRFTGDRANALFLSLDPFALGGPVSWAGPEPAPVWLDVAREFTERWHHQQHIRDALGRPGCTEAYFLKPVLATFVRALPQTYRQVEAALGTCVRLTITGDSGGEWSVAREGATWQLYEGRSPDPQAEVELPEEVAWRLFTRGISAAQAGASSRLLGDTRLAQKALETVSILA